MGEQKENGRGGDRRSQLRNGGGERQLCRILPFIEEDMADEDWEMPPGLGHMESRETLTRAAGLQTGLGGD